MLTSRLTHIYLSPHLDDAVLSCGGMIHRQTQAGERVVVVTVCAGDPPPGPLSAFAQALHQRWSEIHFRGQPTPGEVVAARRAEDLAALGVLRAEALHLDIQDCIYRIDPVTGLPLYDSQAALFGDLHPFEMTLVRQLAGQFSALLRGFGRRRVYAPLGLGHHIDHQLTRRAADMAGAIYAYVEDYPYAAEEADAPSSSASGTSGARSAPLPTRHALSPELIPLDQSNLDAKVTAIAQYVSQISSFWADVAVMAAEVRKFAQRVGSGKPAERIWLSG